MESNFSFLHQEFEPMFATVQRAETFVFTDPMYCAILCRKSLEEFVKWLYDNDQDLELPHDTTLNSLVHEQSFINIIPQGHWRNINVVRKVGNNAVHGSAKIPVKESLAAIKIIHDFALWVVRIYSRSSTPIVQFDESILPKGDLVERTKAQAEQLAKQYDETRQQLERANEELEKNERLAEELKQKLAEVNVIKQSHKDVPIPPLSVTEAETRRLYIDAMLKEAGWDVDVPNCREFEVTGMPFESGKGYADYVLWGDDGKPLAVVEAKKTLREAYIGKRQAELYANCLEKMYCQRPFIFYTNGFETHFWDDIFYTPREVQGFYTKDELQTLINRRSLRTPLSAQSINKQIAGRAYQEEAIKRVAETLERKARGALLVMATGSGKTRTAAAITDMLTKANWAKRILFLADRNALVTQAKNAFNNYLPHLTAIDLTKEDEDTASRIVFSTYPTMMNRIDSARSEGERYFGVGHFDVVIIDEAHRSIYMRYKALFKYFDAIFIGLTATPKADSDKDTYELFGLEPHNPTFAYELDKAVNEKYLVPPKGIKVGTKFLREGIKYDELTEDEKKEFEKDFADQDGEMPEEIDSAALNAWLFNANTVDKVLQTLFKNGLKIEGGDKIGKTIIFAKSHDHAVFIEERFNTLFPEHRGKQLRVIDNRTYNPQSLIYEFSDKDKTEFQIAVSVDMLDTGIDIPEVLNLVLFRAIRSKAKFWQMIGRGTRLRPDLFGPDNNKEEFYVFDYCGNLDFFNSNIKEDDAEITGTLSEKIFKAKLNVAFLLGATREDGEGQILMRQYLDELNRIVCGFNAEDFRVRMELKYVEKYRPRGQWDDLQQTEVIEIERHLAPLYIDEVSTESARRFDLTILHLMEHAIENNSQQLFYQNKIKSSVRGLLKKMSIPQVKEQEILIRSILADDYWQHSNITTHEFTRQSLRSLLEYVEPEEKRVLYTNYTDTHEVAEDVELISSYQALGSYRKRIEKFLRDNGHNITIHRIRNNQPITQQELDVLEDLLFSIDEHGNKESLQKVTHGKPLGTFIRSILGLDVNAAKEAFSEFLGNGKLSSTQIHFIDTIINYLSKNGTIDKTLLFEPPFTTINDQGIAGVFPHEQAAKIISIVDRINKNAEVG